MCFFDGLIIPNCDAPQNETDGAIIYVLEKVQSGRKIIKMIAKQHHVTSVNYSGDGFFDKDGRHMLIKPEPSFKYCIDYNNCVDGKECTWCFN